MRQIDTVHDHIAGHYEKTATELEREARDLRRRAKEARLHSDDIKKIYAWRDMAVCVRQLTLQGETLENAIAETARQNALPIESIAWYVEREKKEDKFVARWWRDREIMRLAYLGWTNKAIGARVGLSEQWTSTLLQRRLRQGWQLTQALGEIHQHHKR